MFRTCRSARPMDRRLTKLFTRSSKPPRRGSRRRRRVDALSPRPRRAPFEPDHRQAGPWCKGSVCGDRRRRGVDCQRSASEQRWLCGAGRRQREPRSSSLARLSASAGPESHYVAGDHHPLVRVVWGQVHHGPGQREPRDASGAAPRANPPRRRGVGHSAMVRSRHGLGSGRSSNRAATPRMIPPNSRWASVQIRM